MDISSLIIYLLCFVSSNSAKMVNTKNSKNSGLRSSASTNIYHVKDLHTQETGHYKKLGIKAHSSKWWDGYVKGWYDGWNQGFNWHKDDHGHHGGGHHDTHGHHDGGHHGSFGHHGLDHSIGHSHVVGKVGYAGDAYGYNAHHGAESQRHTEHHNIHETGHDINGHDHHISGDGRSGHNLHGQVNLHDGHFHGHGHSAETFEHSEHTMRH